MYRKIVTRRSQKVNMVLYQRWLYMIKM